MSNVENVVEHELCLLEDQLRFPRRKQKTFHMLEENKIGEEIGLDNVQSL